MDSPLYLEMGVDFWGRTQTRRRCEKCSQRCLYAQGNILLQMFKAIFQLDISHWTANQRYFKPNAFKDEFLISIPFLPPWSSLSQQVAILSCQLLWSQNWKSFIIPLALLCLYLIHQLYFLNYQVSNHFYSPSLLLSEFRPTDRFPSNLLFFYYCLFKK